MSDQPDHYRRVVRHCESGLSLTKASMARFVMHCLEKNIEICQIWPLNHDIKGSLVCAVVKLRPDQIEPFEASTGGKLRMPPRAHLNSDRRAGIGEEG